MSMLKVQSLIGVFVLILLAWSISENRKKLNFRVIGGCLFLQFSVALLFLSPITAPYSQKIFLALNQLAVILQESSKEGTTFVFGYLGGGVIPFEVTNPKNLFVLGIEALPLVLLISALSSVFFYWRVLPMVVRGVAFILRKTTGISGALGLSVSANIFVGMVEAPLMVRPYVSKMSRSELFTLMVSGMATVAGTVMFLYASFLAGIVPDPIGHILTASIISAPAAILISILMVPREKGLEEGDAEYTPVISASSTMDALVKGVDAGTKLLISIISMLIVMVALVAILNAILGLLPGEFTLQKILGVAMAPVVWLTGIPWSECETAGQLMGTKTVLNELFAYINLSQLPEGALSERSRIIMTYSLCGFANFGSLGIIYVPLPLPVN